MNCVWRKGDDAVRKSYIHNEFEGVEHGFVRLRDSDVGQLCGLSEHQSDHHGGYNLSATESGSVRLCEEGGSEAETESEGGSTVPRQRVEGSRVHVNVLTLGAPLDGLTDGPSWILSG